MSNCDRDQLIICFEVDSCHLKSYFEREQSMVPWNSKISKLFSTRITWSRAQLNVLPLAECCQVSIFSDLYTDQVIVDELRIESCDITFWVRICDCNNAEIQWREKDSWSKIKFKCRYKWDACKVQLSNEGNAFHGNEFWTHIPYMIYGGFPTIP